MFLRDLNILFWQPDDIHRPASLPGHSRAAAVETAFLCMATGRAGQTSADVIWGVIFTPNQKPSEQQIH